MLFRYKYQYFMLALIHIFTSAPNALNAQEPGIGLIRDTEIENTIRIYAAPIFTVTDLNIKSIRIHLVNDKSLNAFVSGGQQIFINIGLLMQTDEPEEVVGVLAHEIGHITSGHLARFQEGFENARIQSMAGLLLGIPTAILSGRSDIAAASLALGSHIGQRSILQYSRSMEQGADQAALGFLDKAQISSSGLLRFLNRIKEIEKLYPGSNSEYTRTHPLTKNRLEHIENHMKDSQYTNKKLSRKYTLLHERMRAKLHGYILPAQELTAYYPRHDISASADYARAINLMRRHQTDAALDRVNKLIAYSPKDPFFYELKGDIYRQAGRMEMAVAPYEKALTFLPWAALIRIALAHVQIEIGTKETYQDAIANLNKALRYEPWNIRGWQLIATAYGRSGDYGNAALAQAEMSDLQGLTSAAITQAQKAQRLLAEGSAGHLRAEDIEYQNNQKQGKSQ